MGEGRVRGGGRAMAQWSRGGWKGAATQSINPVGQRGEGRWQPPRVGPATAAADGGVGARLPPHRRDARPATGRHGHRVGSKGGGGWVAPQRLRQLAATVAHGPGHSPSPPRAELSATPGPAAAAAFVHPVFYSLGRRPPDRAGDWGFHLTRHDWAQARRAVLPTGTIVYHVASGASGSSASHSSTRAIPTSLVDQDLRKAAVC